MNVFKGVQTDKKIFKNLTELKKKFYCICVVCTVVSENVEMLIISLLQTFF